MKAFILAGGLGTRLAEETHRRPKPMDTLSEQKLLNNLYSKNLAPWKIW